MGNEASVQPGDYKEPVLPDGVMQVRISVYKLNVTGVGFLDSLGASLAGAYHSGLVVNGQEWSFGCHDEAGISGVYAVEPEMNPDYTFYQRLVVGEVRTSKEELSSAIKSLRHSQEWEGTSYDLVEHNCNHFTSELCWLLLRKRPPDWINNTANNMARSRRQERAEEAVLQAALEEYEVLHGGSSGSTAAPLSDSSEDSPPAPGAKAFESMFKSTFQLKYALAWDNAKASLEVVAEGEDPEEVKGKAEVAAIEAASTAALTAASAVAAAARLATAARAAQPEVGVHAWDAAWQKESSNLLKTWQNAAIAGGLSPDHEALRTEQVMAILQEAAEAASAAAQAARSERAMPPARPEAFV